MLAQIRQWADAWLGRGSASIAVPVMDGALRPNRAIDRAHVVAELPGLDDLGRGGAQGDELWVSAGQALYRLEGDALAEQRRFDAPVSAFALARDGRLAVALDGTCIEVHDAAGTVQARVAQVAGTPLVCVNALAWDDTGRLVFTDGSSRHGPKDWVRDLMTLGRTGRVLRWDLGSNAVEVLRSGMAHAFGVLAHEDGEVLASESWRHQVVRLVGPPRGNLVADLPGYPSRMAAGSEGSLWVTCFVCRTQLVEFVLRERAYRTRMVQTIAPEYWIAPALSSGHSFLEPLQGAAVKNMGVLKPWAPPRSYGLVIEVQTDGRIRRSLHSRVDGKHHGVTAVAQIGPWLYVASKGSGRLLRVDLSIDHDRHTDAGAAQ
jgi:sugar lactone lactonase YvrE